MRLLMNGRVAVSMLLLVGNLKRFDAFTPITRGIQASLVVPVPQQQQQQQQRFQPSKNVLKATTLTPNTIVHSTTPPADESIVTDRLLETLDLSSEESTRTTTTTKEDARKRWRLWSFLLASLMVTSFVPRTDVATNLFPSQPDLLQSSVSAISLRSTASSSSPIKYKAVLHFLFSSVLIWRIIQSLNLFHNLAIGVNKFCNWYMVCLAARPLVTKAITAAFIGISGDAAAQAYAQRKGEKQTLSSSSSTSRLGFSLIPNYNIRRGFSVIVDDLFITGPLLHFSYNWLETLFPVHAAATTSASLAAISQVLIDDFFLDVIFVAIMFVTTGIGEGYVKEIIPQMKKDFIPTIKASWMTSLVLMPIEFICFRFLPLSLRVLGMNIIDIFWAAMVSYMAHRNRCHGGPGGRHGKEQPQHS